MRSTMTLSRSRYCFPSRWRRVWGLPPVLWVLLWRREEPVYKMWKRSVSQSCNSTFIFLWLHHSISSSQLQWWCLLFLPPPGRFLTTQQTCVSKCPGGFFASRLSGVCEACPPGCLQCVDAQHCTRCQSTRKAQLFLQDGQCVQQCVRSGVNPTAVFF